MNSVTKRRLWTITFVLGVLAIAGLGALLIYNGVMATGVPTQSDHILKAYHTNGFIGLAFFGIVAVGYMYFMLQLFGNSASTTQQQRLSRLTDSASLIMIGLMVAALAQWNIALLG